jgi:hypothetical protein
MNVVAVVRRERRVPDMACVRKRSMLDTVGHFWHVRSMTVGGVLLAMLGVWLAIIVAMRVVPVMRHGRTVVLERPKPCSMREAEHALERLLSAGIDAEIVEHDDNGLNMWANTKAGGEVRPDERYVIRVPRRQAAAAARL